MFYFPRLLGGGGVQVIGSKHIGTPPPNSREWGTNFRLFLEIRHMTATMESVSILKAGNKTIILTGIW